MGANSHGLVKWFCYNDCDRGGCPGHTATLWSKHGGYYLENENRERFEIHSDIGLIDAIAKTLEGDPE